jgi:uncharacterized protein (TIGR03382 family)
LQVLDTVSGGMSASVTPLANAVVPDDWFAAHVDEPTDGDVSPPADGGDEVDSADGAIDGTDLPTDGDEVPDTDGDGAGALEGDDAARPRPDSGTPTRDDVASEASGETDSSETDSSEPASAGCSSVGGPVAPSWTWLLGLVVLVFMRRRVRRI